MLGVAEIEVFVNMVVLQAIDAEAGGARVGVVDDDSGGAGGDVDAEDYA